MLLSCRVGHRKALNSYGRRGQLAAKDVWGKPCAAFETPLMSPSWASRPAVSDCNHPWCPHGWTDPKHELESSSISQNRVDQLDGAPGLLTLLCPHPVSSLTFMGKEGKRGEWESPLLQRGLSYRVQATEACSSRFGVVTQGPLFRAVSLDYQSLCWILKTKGKSKASYSQSFSLSSVHNLRGGTQIWHYLPASA